MSGSVDTNILARALLNDDARQSLLARQFLRDAGVIAVSIVVFTELVWVLRMKKVPANTVADMLETLVESGQVQTDDLRFAAGLAFMRRGGDFADGVALHEARQSQRLPLRTFDRQFARLGAPDVVLIS